MWKTKVKMVPAVVEDLVAVALKLWKYFWLQIPGTSLEISVQKQLAVNS